MYKEFSEDFINKMTKFSKKVSISTDKKVLEFVNENKSIQFRNFSDSLEIIPMIIHSAEVQNFKRYSKSIREADEIVRFAKMNFQLELTKNK